MAEGSGDDAASASQCVFCRSKLPGRGVTISAATLGFSAVTSFLPDSVQFHALAQAARTQSSRKFQSRASMYTFSKKNGRVPQPVVPELRAKPIGLAEKFSFYCKNIMTIISSRKAVGFGGRTASPAGAKRFWDRLAEESAQKNEAFALLCGREKYGSI